MSTLEIKADILDAVAKEEDLGKLSLLHAFVLRYFSRQELPLATDEMNEPDWLVEEFEKAIIEIASPENTVSHKEALKLIKSWKGKKLSGAK